MAGGAPVQEERRSAWFVKGAGEAFRSALAAISQPWQRAGVVLPAFRNQTKRRAWSGSDVVLVEMASPFSYDDCCVVRCAVVDTAQVAVLIWRNHATPLVQCPEGKASQDYPAMDRGGNRF